MNELVEIRENQVVVTSRQVAERFGKNHRDVLESIASITKAENSALVFFHRSTYRVPGNFKKYPEYIMNKDGFSLLAMGFTGRKALQWKLKYIEAFNKMEEALKHPTAKQLPEPLKCKYFRGVPCTTILDLAVLAGIDRAYVLQLLKTHQIPYLMLSGQDLLDYRKENRAFKTNSRLIILSKQSVTELLSSIGKDTVANLERVRQYFHLPKEPVRRQTRLNTELTIRQLYVLRNTLPYLVSKEDRDVLAKYIVDRLMELDLFRPSDYPCENIYDMDINSVAGWNTSSCIQNAHTLIERGVQVTRQALLDFKDGLLD